MNVSRLMRNRKVLRNMIADRGYAVPDPVDVASALPRMLADAAKSEQQFIVKAAMHCTHSATGTELIVVQTLQRKLGVTTVRFINEMIEERYPDCSDVLVVYNDSITPCGKKTLSTVNGRKIQVSPSLHWSYNITHSGHVPLHRRLTSEERTHYFETNPTVSPTDLPRMRSDDKIVLYYGWVRGDVICIDRFGRNYNVARRYRIVH